MSLDKVASHLAAQGRGPDTTLVHMSPREVGALQSIAKQHGGSLTINPQTGLAEAGFLDAILPVVAGAGLSMIPGVGPLMAAGIVGAGTGLLTKDLNKGLMAGLGAFGGASLAGSLMSAGSAAGSTAAAAETAAAAGSLYTPAEIASMQAAGLSPAEIATSAADYVGGASGVGTANMPFSQATQSALNNPAMAGLSEISKAPGAFFKKNMFPIGAAAAPLLMGGGDLFGGGEKKEEAAPGYIRPQTYTQTRNPNYTGAGTPYFTQSYTPQEPVLASEWGNRSFAGGGIVALAEGGQPGIEMQRYERPVRQMAPEVAAYNQQLMERANQQYNVNLRPAPNQVPGSAGYIAPPAPMAPATSSGESFSGLTFNPVTQQFEGEFKAPGSKDRSSMFGSDMDEDRYADLDARYMRQNYDGNVSSNANGGRITQRYNQGGISSLGSYSDGGRMLKGPGDGVSDSIPATIGGRQPARLATEEFVVPARIVSELGNGSSEAGAKQLYGMMDRVEKARRKSVGKGKIAVDTKARKHLPA
jgi:hypothetical protein